MSYIHERMKEGPGSKKIEGRGRGEGGEDRKEGRGKRGENREHTIHILQTRVR